MKKENIQSRNRKLSAKSRKKHSSFASAAASIDMLKPLEKMYGYGMAAAGMTGMTGMPGGMTAAGLTAASPYSYMTAAAGAGQAAGMSAMAAAHANTHAMSAAAAAGFGPAAAAGMHHMAPGGFGAASSFGSMVSAYTNSYFEQLSSKCPQITTNTFCDTFPLFASFHPTL